MNYADFLKAKIQTSPSYGFDIADSETNPILKPHQRDIVRWAVKRGRAAIFAAFGLGKTVIQLECARILAAKTNAWFLIVAPLGVREEFMRDAEMLGIKLKFIRTVDDCDGSSIYITNYESVRDGKIDPRLFGGVSLDEATCLRGFGGTKTFRQMMAYFEGSGKFRIVATATPSPNDYIELLAYAAFLDVMDVSQGKTRFFKRNSEKADELTLHPHKEREFWLWCSTWAVFLQKPSDLGYSDEGYELPQLEVHWHEIPSDHENAGQEPSGQGRLIKNARMGVTSASREKRDSLQARVAKLKQIVSQHDQTLYGFQQFIAWCDLNDEQAAIDKVLDELGCSYSSLYGNQDIDDREDLMRQWRSKQTSGFVSKPSMYGAGTNLQQCHHEIFVGIGFKFFEFIQAIHRCYRFLQQHTVRIDLIYTEAERGIRADLEEKWEKHKELVAQMSAIIRQYGLSSNALAEQMTRNMGVERVEVSGEGWTAIQNDCVLETAEMPANSVDLILTSIPFSTQYEYSPNYADFGHSDSNEHFWQQMDFLIPNLYRILQPGRVAAIHVKDRITPSGLTGMGFQTVYPFHGDAIRYFTTCPDCRIKQLKYWNAMVYVQSVDTTPPIRKAMESDVRSMAPPPCNHRFGFLGMKTIVTDVVRENNQTYRLGWSEQCKDGSRMGCGMPEYLLLFRKPPTDTSNGYADVPVVKSKADYTRSRWQIDAHGFARSDGNRLLAPEDLAGIPHERIFKLFRADSLANVYSFDRHVALSESLERCQECGHVHTGDRKCGHVEETPCPRCDGTGEVCYSSTSYAGCPDCKERGTSVIAKHCPCRIAGSRLPATFMLLQPQSWHEDVWTDIARMRTTNMLQAAAGKEMHLCPLQWDICDRVITQFSQPDETVFDPFMGIGTVPLRALKLGRRGVGTELSTQYFTDAVGYLRLAESELAIPSLFDLLEDEVSA